MPRSVPPLETKTDGAPHRYITCRPSLAKVTKLKKSGWLLVCNSGHSCTDELLTGFQLRVAFRGLANLSIAPQMNYLQV